MTEASWQISIGRCAEVRLGKAPDEVGKAPDESAFKLDLSLARAELFLTTGGPTSDCEI